MTLDYFYGQSGELFAYFRISKALFQDSRFRQLSTDARTLYGILLDRMSLSVKNNWLDEQGRVYIIYTVREVQESLCCAEHKAVKLFRELEQTDLIERKRRGLGRPSLIYVKKTKAGIRIIPMLDEVFDAFLEEYQYQKVIGFCTDEIDGYSGFVFCTGDGKVYLPNAINRTIRSICADYNKEEESKAKEENRDPVFLPKFSCHILRHTFCTRFCENETNLKVIQEIMGHADISTTMDVYAEATQEKKKESMTSLQSALLVR